MCPSRRHKESSEADRFGASGAKLFLFEVEGAGLKLGTSRKDPRPAPLNETPPVVQPPEEKERMTPGMGERQRETGRERRGWGWGLSPYQQLPTVTRDHMA